MQQKVASFLGKTGFYVVFLFGLLHYGPIRDALGQELTSAFKLAFVCIFFACVLVSGDEVIDNAEKRSGVIVGLFAKISGIITAVNNSLKNKDDT